jgi:putative membrane protein insertion efficiency factor
LYRWTLSPALAFCFGPYARCRFTPSCSQYALDAIRTHGAFRGGWLAAKRIGRCHPWGDCGHDPVPPARAGGQRAEVRGQHTEVHVVSIAPGRSN